MGQTQWAGKGGYNKAAITKMKTALQAIEGQLRESYPATDLSEREARARDIKLFRESYPSTGLSDREAYAREAVLSAMGSLASTDERRLSNPAYVRNIHESIEMVTTPPVGKTHNKIQEAAVKLVTGNKDVMKGLGQLEAAISSKLTSPNRDRA